MPISEKQLAANRANAQKSTGPVTNEGRAASCQNAVRHGLYARNLVIDSPKLRESQEEYDLLLASLIEELQPETSFQELLVQKIAACIWRNRRVITAETAQIMRQLDNVEFRAGVAAYADRTCNPNRRPDPDSDPAERMAEIESQIIGSSLLPDDTSSKKFLRYESRLDRQLARTYRMLQQLKEAKNKSGKKNETMTP